ncbi:hypothetical protein EIK79_00630 [Halocatena pleomorpha]|uniref:Uncharacterized protein n=1 Tax=Halocatena pleomorpha TaxID=1785090 RepID=A0A3P3RME5_9EURY|nr:hypothetical protein EIK79_00630 [Halocatena pleomorpha]
MVIVSLVLRTTPDVETVLSEVAQVAKLWTNSASSNTSRETE